jgi:hypothetical protein
MTHIQLSASLSDGMPHTWGPSPNRPAMTALDNLSFFADFHHQEKTELLSVASFKQMQRGSCCFAPAM